MRTAYTHPYLILCDDDFQVYPDGLLIVDDGVIAYSGAFDNKYLEIVDQVIDYSGKWLMPGLINTHTHNLMTLLRGCSDDTVLQDWLENHIWPAEAQFTPDITDTALNLAMLEMLQTGTTTFNDMYNVMGSDLDRHYQSVEKSKMRCYFSPTLFSTPTISDDEVIKQTRKLLEQTLSYHNPRFKAMVAPHAPYSCSKTLLAKSIDLAKEMELMVHMHVAETKEESQTILKKYGKRPISFLDELGYLDHPSVFAHSLDLTDEEMKRLAQSQVGIAHNPISNLKLASGVARVQKLHESHLPLGIATDSVASNNNLDLFEDLKMAALLQKGIYQNATYMDLSTTLKMVTIDAAKVLHLEDEIGSLEVGKKADFIVIDPSDKPHLYPQENVLSHLVYSLRGNDIQDVYIEGEQVVQNRQVLTIDSSSVYQAIQDLSLAF